MWITATVLDSEDTEHLHHPIEQPCIKIATQGRNLRLKLRKVVFAFMNFFAGFQMNYVIKKILHSSLP